MHYIIHYICQTLSKMGGQPDNTQQTNYCNNVQLKYINN